MIENTEIETLHQLQEDVLGQIQVMGDAQFGQAKLCGGTAMARCWLGHRASYDLDFFLPEGFDARRMATALKAAAIAYETREIVDDPRKANQLHGYVHHQGQRLKVSFLEDAYFDVFPAVKARFGGLNVNTEQIEGLYHRKLRTVAGGGSEGDSFEGGRQTARDLFDLYVLSVAVMPLRPFMATLPYAFPSDAFDDGLVSMPWLDLMHELKEIVCDQKWGVAKDVAFLQDALYEQIGAQILDEFVPDLDPTPGLPKATSRVKRRGRGGLAR